MKTFPWDEFRLVKAIADTRSLQGAADVLGVNHSTVFRRLAELEDKAGGPLFERHRSGYQLTPAGEAMAAVASRIDSDVSDFMRKLAGKDIRPRGEIRVTTNDTLLLYLLVPVLARFRAEYPDIRVDIIMSNQALNLSKRDADIAIRATDSPPDNLTGRRVSDLVWAIYGRRSDWPKGGKDFDVERPPEDANWVSLGDGFSHLHAVRYIRDHVKADRVALTINTVLGLAEAVEAGIGIGPLPCFIADARPGLVRLSPVDPDFSTGLWLLTHPDLKASPRVRAFLDLAAAELQKNRMRLEGRASGVASER
ncbi:MAG: LysR family transcriptional regulator [Beijerinckiaceae bacterium]|nr:LysR family transcriptional regulator [Beijerinckiaceae bacterium]